MKIALITPTPRDVFAFGVRTISSVLKSSGHEVVMIFLPGGIEKLRFGKAVSYRYAGNILERIVSLCRDAQLIGVSFMTHYFDRAVQVTEALKKQLDAPIVWGGIHPTVAPIHSLQYADIVCVGEGEDAFLELANRMEKGQECYDIKNFCFKKNDVITQNPIRNLEHNLDHFPPMDYNLEGHYIYDAEENAVLGMDALLLERFLPRISYFDHRLISTYRTMATRGCPHNCSFCTSPVLKKMYAGERYLRHRSVGHLIAELKDVTERYPFIESISFFDDTLFALDANYIEELGERYKAEIRLPMYVQGSPSTISKRKLDALVHAGCVFVEMGIQTGSLRTQVLYRRNTTNEKIAQSAGLIAEYGERLLPPDYHIILDNPWETTEDLLQTLRLLLRLPTPFTLSISSLVFFPQTELTRRAVDEKLSDGNWLAVGRKPFLYPTGSYVHYLIFLSGIRTVPRPLIRFLARRRLVSIFERRVFRRGFGWLFHITEYAVLSGKGLRALARGDVGRIFRYVRRSRTA